MGLLSVPALVTFAMAETSIDSGRTQPKPLTLASRVAEHLTIEVPGGWLESFRTGSLDSAEAGLAIGVNSMVSLPALGLEWRGPETTDSAD